MAYQLTYKFIKTYSWYLPKKNGVYLSVVGYSTETTWVN